MSDNQTLRDHIEDLMTERNEHLRTIQRLQMIADKAFTMSNGHIQGCLLAMMCNCGFMHWQDDRDKQ